MHPPARDSGATPAASDIVVCLEAIARALHGEFQPRAFLADFSTALQPFVPAKLPLVESEAGDGIKIRGAPDLVMSENPRPKENPHRLAFAGSGLDGEPLEHAMQFGGKLRGNQRAGRRRIDAERRA